MVEEMPDYHIVQSGDTLWDISAYYHGDPYLWPKVWSWNEHVTNPHWIFPGDRIRLYDPTRDRGQGGRDRGPSLRFGRTELPPGRGEGTYLLDQTAFVDKAPNKFNRRWRPRAMGRATRITKGVSHIVIELDQRK